MDVHNHHKQSSVLALETLITILMVIDMAISTITTYRHSTIGLCTLLDITMVLFYVFLMIYLFWIEFNVNEDMFGLAL